MKYGWNQALDIVLRDLPGPTPHTYRNTPEEISVSAWKLLIDDPMLRLIQKFTEAEARWVLADEIWYLLIEELEAFISRYNFFIHNYLEPPKYSTLCIEVS